MDKHDRQRPILEGARFRLRPGFLFTVSLGGLVGVALVAFVVSRFTSGTIETEQVNAATRSAELLAASGFGPRIATGTRPLTSAQLRAIDEAALAARRTAGLDGVIIWGAQSHVLYSTDRRLIGSTSSPSADVSAALTGRTMTSVRGGAELPIVHSSSRQIDIAVPLYHGGQAAPIAVAEVILPYAPVAQVISSDTQRINLILIGAAILFYAAIWPRLLQASRAVRRQNDPRKAAALRELERAIKRDELLLHYQPAVDLAEGRVVAVEALLRWRHPRRGLLAPSDFLPAVVGEELNAQLALHVIGIALRDCAAWRDRGIDAAVNVNLSATNALDAGLPEQIGQLLGATGIPADVLGLEVTETAIVADPERATTMLNALDRMGVRIAIDDFGTGYSSLAGLRDLPVSELKIDRQFVSLVHTRARDEAIVRSTIRLAHELEIKVIAEGVEDAETLELLAALDCDMAQGYYFSRPLPLAELVAWFEEPIVAGRVEEPVLAGPLELSPAAAQS
jgi:EAL domain-containing protein (putative c-di-GMP-specific phosphodiesterase class I)